MADYTHIALRSHSRERVGGVQGIGVWLRSRRRRGGYSLIEIVVVIAIVAVAAAMTMPGITDWAVQQRVKSASRSVANALAKARSEAIRTGNNHLVFFQTDAQINPLDDGSGTVVPISIVNDDRPGGAGQNCLVDAGEIVGFVRGEQGVNWGVTNATTRVPTDFGTGAITTGSSFTEPDGDPATWVLFRPDGATLSFDAACATGTAGSGAGAVYLTNGTRDLAIVVTPFGGLRVHSWDRQGGQWTD